MNEAACLRRFGKPRSKGIGGTLCGVICELNNYESPLDAALLMCKLRTDDFRENQFTDWGKRGERHVAQKYADDHKVKLLDPRTRYVHGDIPWFFGTPDRLIVAPKDHGLGPGKTRTMVVRGRRYELLPRGLEVKTSQAKDEYKWPADGWLIEDFQGAKDAGFNLQYWAQAQHYMELMAFNEWDFAIKYDSAQYRSYRLLRDYDWMHSVAIPKMQAFWDDCKAGRLPPIMWGRHVNKWLDEKHGPDDGTIRTANIVESSVISKLKEVDEALIATNEKLIEVKMALYEAKLKLKGKQKTDRIAELVPELHAYEHLQSEHYKAQGTLTNHLRDAIGVNSGIETAQGDRVTWKKGKDTTKTRRFSKSWR